MGRPPKSGRGDFLPPLLLLLLGQLVLLFPGPTASITNTRPVQEPTELQIGESLERKLNESMASQAVKYISVNSTGLPYNATTRFNPKGMRQLYNLTNMFINLIQDKQAYPDGTNKTFILPPFTFTFDC